MFQSTPADERRGNTEPLRGNRHCLTASAAHTAAYTAANVSDSAALAVRAKQKEIIKKYLGD